MPILLHVQCEGLQDQPISITLHGLEDLEFASENAREGIAYVAVIQQTQTNALNVAGMIWNGTAVVSVTKGTIMFQTLPGVGLAAAR